ncbi:unnamed protein product [Caretta caretta]
MGKALPSQAMPCGARLTPELGALVLLPPFLGSPEPPRPAPRRAGGSPERTVTPARHGELGSGPEAAATDRCLRNRPSGSGGGDPSLEPANSATAAREGGAHKFLPAGGGGGRLCLLPSGPAARERGPAGFGRHRGEGGHN